MLPLAFEAALLMIVIAFGMGMLYSLWRSRAQIERLREQDTQLRKLLRAVEQSPSTVVITDLKGDIEYVNPKFTALTGYTFEEVRGKNPRILKSGYTPAAEYTNLWRTIKAGGEWRGEMLNRKKNGDLYWEFTTISPVKDSNGTITHYLAVKEDISARKEAEEALRHSETYNKAVLASVPDLVFRFNRDGMYLDARGDPQIRLRSFDEPLDFTVGKTLFDLLPERTARLIHTAISRALDTNEIQIVDYQLDTISGPIDFEARIVRIGPDEVISVARDTTERKQIEEQIKRHNRDLTLLNRVISAATSTFDITDLLNIICRELALAFDVPQAATALLDLDRTAYEVIAEYLSPGGTSALGVRFPIDNNPVVDYMLTHRTPLVIPNVLADSPLVMTPQRRENMAARGTVTLLIVPLLVGDELIGTIGLDSLVPREFTEDEVILASSVAAALSHALHNAYLYRQLRANQVRLKAILDNTAIGISLIGAEGQYIQTNDRWAEMLGYGAEELVPRSHFDFIHPDDVADCRAKMEMLRRDERDAYRNEVRFVCSSGDVFWGDVSASAIRAPDGQLEGVVLGVIDVSERKEAEDALRIKDSAIASSNNGIALADLDGKLTYVNAAFLKMWGYTARWEVIDRPAVNFWQNPAQAADIIRALQTEGSWIGEMVAARKDGTPFDVQLTASMVTNMAEQPICMMASFVDITARKRAEAERERLISELNAFAHTVAHDLKTPLQGLVGYASLLTEDITLFSQEELLHYLEIIVLYGRKMNSIINELMLLASVRTQEDVAIEDVDMGAVIQSALERLDFMIHQHKAEVSVLPDSWPVACGYAPWIEEVWTNFISNAIKYGGSPPRVELGADVLPDGRVRCWVRDNGPGIPAEKQGQLFTEFARLGQMRVEGHGLGLSIVQRIIDRLGGDVGVESRVGQGSTFSFTLPGVNGHEN